MIEALEGWVAHLSLWAGAPDRTGRAQLLTGLQPLATAAAADGRPALRLLLVALAKATASVNDADTAQCLAEGGLAALEWAQGRDPAELGLDPAVRELLHVAGLPPERTDPLLQALRREAHSRAATSQEASDGPAASAVVEPEEQPPAQAAEPATSASMASAAADATRVAGDHSVVPARIPEPAVESVAEPEVEPGAGHVPERSGEAAANDDPAVDEICWVSPEEQGLIVETLYAEVLPALSDWSAQAPPKSFGAPLDFLLGATRNALEVIGLTAMAGQLGRAVAALQLSLDSSDGDEIAGRLAEWLLALAGWLEAPSAERLADLEQGTWLSAPGDAAHAAWIDEAQRVRIGLDPAHLQRALRQVQPGDLDLQPASDVFPSVLQGMLRELPGNSARLADAVGRFQREGDREALDQARRVAHTLKGDANTVGIRGLANLTHALEDILVELDKQQQQPQADTLDLLQEAADTVAEMADHILGRAAVPAEAEAMLARVYAFANALDGLAPAEPATTEPPGASLPAPAEPDQAPVSVVASQPALAKPTPAEPAPAEPVEQLSVGRDLLDRLLEYSGESLALSNQVLNELDAVDRLQQQLSDELLTLGRITRSLDEQVAIRGAALNLARRERSDIDPLELDQYNDLYVLSRQLAETQSDSRLRLQALEAAHGRLQRLGRGKGRLDQDLQATVQSARLVPIRDLRNRFERTVRQTARALDKQVDLQIEGDALTIDKLLLDGLTEPLMHLLRNAVDHGVEPTDLRIALGKPANGQLLLQFEVQGAWLSVRLKDDGAGLDEDRIRARALAMGLIDEDAALDSLALRSLLFVPGFSTRDEVSQISGRGVGMDVVARRVQELGGTIVIDTHLGQGTQFELRLPTRLGTLQVALVPLDKALYAVACDSFEGFQPLGPEERRQVDDRLEVLIGEQWLPALDFGRLVGARPLAVNDRRHLVAFLADLPGEGQRVILCERVEALVTVVLKPLGEFLPNVAGVRGATVLGDGRVACVLDLREQLRQQRTLDLNIDLRLSDAEMAPTIVVADDSLTVRRSLGELLEDAGFRPVLARDGLEALLEIEQQSPKALLVDLEMPRMNGLELTAHLRQLDGYRNLPIIMITSRTAERHQQMATEAGVSYVLGKPYSDDELLSVLERLLEAEPTAEALSTG